MGVCSTQHILLLQVKNILTSEQQGTMREIVAETSREGEGEGVGR
jgi:hypothetical protein